jgi:hypothetical protein
MATLLNPDGSTLEITPEDRAKGFSLEELYMLLDCDIVQRLKLGGDPERFMLMDENAKIRNPSPMINLKASSILREIGWPRYTYVSGKVLLVTRKEFQ